MKKYDVFISYRRSNGKDLANSFNMLLKTNGYSTYLDIGEEYAGDFREKIVNVIENSSLMLILVTEDSLIRMHDEGDISRLELETALKSGIDILPISIIGEKMFEDVNHESSPECVKKLLNYNTRFYTHETQRDTNDFILNVCKNIRKDKFNKDINRENFNFINHIYKILEVNNQPLSSVLGLGDEYIYSGNLKNNIPYGKGVLTNTKTKERYEIDFDGTYSMRGEGRIYRNTELIYEGNTKNLKPDGQGIQYKDGDTYEGYFNKGMRDLLGILKTSNGSYYEGEFRNGIPNGVGYMKTPEGDEYKGEISKGEISGEGVLLKVTGEKFQGTIQPYTGELKGVKEYGNFIYVGSFDIDLTPNKTIKVYDLNEETLVFEGDFQNGLKNGRGEANLKGEYLNTLPLPQFKIECIDYNLTFNPSENYKLIGNYIDDKLQIEQDLQIVDMKGNVLIRYYSNGTTLYNNGSIEVSNTYILVKDTQGTTRVDRIGNEFEVVAIYTLNKDIYTDTVRIDLNKQTPPKLTGLNDDGKKVEIHNIKTKLPNLILEKIKRFDLGGDKDNVTGRKNEGITIQF